MMETEANAQLHRVTPQKDRKLNNRNVPLSENMLWSLNETEVSFRDSNNKSKHVTASAATNKKWLKQFKKMF
jgi:hypothetical protein